MLLHGHLTFTKYNFSGFQKLTVDFPLEPLQPFRTMPIMLQVKSMEPLNDSVPVDFQDWTIQEEWISHVFSSFWEQKRIEGSQLNSPRSKICAFSAH